jgi:hypothetical protein
LLKKRITQLMKPTYVRILLHGDVLRMDKPLVFHVPQTKVTPAMLAVLQSAHNASLTVERLFDQCWCNGDVCTKHPPFEMREKFDAIATLAPSWISKRDVHCQALMEKRLADKELVEVGAWKEHICPLELSSKYTISQTFMISMFL